MTCCWKDYFKRSRIDGNKVRRLRVVRNCLDHGLWYLFFLSPCSQLSPLSLSCQGKLGTWLCSERRFHSTLRAPALEVQNALLHSEISINSPLCSFGHFPREDEYLHELERSSHWHLPLPTEQEPSLSSPTARTWQDKAEWNTELIVPISLISQTPQVPNPFEL